MHSCTNLQQEKFNTCYNYQLIVDPIQRGDTALHIAAAKGHPKCAELLIINGASVNDQAIVSYPFSDTDLSHLDTL